MRETLRHVIPLVRSRESVYPDRYIEYRVATTSALLLKVMLSALTYSDHGIRCIDPPSLSLRLLTLTRVTFTLRWPPHNLFHYCPSWHILALHPPHIVDPTLRSHLFAQHKLRRNFCCLQFLNRPHTTECSTTYPYRVRSVFHACVLCQRCVPARIWTSMTRHVWELTGLPRRPPTQGLIPPSTSSPGTVLPFRHYDVARPDLSNILPYL
jgi:hypothetical protein